MRFEWNASGWHRRRQAVAKKSHLQRRKRILLRRESQSPPMVFVFYVPVFRRGWNCLTVFRCGYFFKAGAAKSWPRQGRGGLPGSGGRGPGGQAGGGGGVG